MGFRGMIKYNINQKTRYGKGLKLASIDEWVREFMIYVLRQESNCSAIALRWDDNEEEEEENDGVSFVLDQHGFWIFFSVSDLTRSRLDLTIYHSRGEHVTNTTRFLSNLNINYATFYFYKILTVQSLNITCLIRIQIRVWRYQRSNQNTYIEEGQTIQWPKEKGQKDKQQSTKHYT